MKPHEGWFGFRWAFRSVSIRSAVVASLTAWIVLFEAPAETTSSLKNAVLVLPFKAPESAKGTDDAYLGFAVANLFENMLAVHDGLAECWLNWHLQEIFSKADDFEAWFASEKEIPPKVTELQLRYLLTGEIWAIGKDLAVHVVLLDQNNGKRWEEHLTIDLPGLQEVRAGLLHLLERAGIKASPVQQSKLLWNEKLSRQQNDLVTQADMLNREKATELSSNWAKPVVSVSRLSSM